MKPEVASSIVALVVVTAAVIVVAALPHLVTVPGAVVVARGLTLGCLAIAYGFGVAVQPWLLPRPPRRRD